MARFTVTVGLACDPRIAAVVAGFGYVCVVLWIAEGNLALVLFNPWLEVVAIGGLFGLGFWAGWRVKPTLGAAVVAGTATALSAVAGAVAASPIVVMLGWEIADDRVIWLLSLVGLASLIGASAGLAGFGACRLLSHRSLAT